MLQTTDANRKLERKRFVHISLIFLGSYNRKLFHGQHKRTLFSVFPCRLKIFYCVGFNRPQSTELSGKLITQWSTG